MTVQTETTTRHVTDTVDNPKPIRCAPTEMVVGIDVGTTKVCSIAGLRKVDGGFHILAHRTVPCNGLSKGNVSDIDATADAIQKSVHSLQEAIGFKIESAYVGVTGSDIAFENRRDDLDRSLDTVSSRPRISIGSHRLSPNPPMSRDAS